MNNIFPVEIVALQDDWWNNASDRTLFAQGAAHAIHESTADEKDKEGSQQRE